MKIVKLRFKNLNSLVGEWEIDFSAPDYISDGIFSISGPTGSGKSTILDAICLALYGRTPRLKVISQSTNEIMSRQSGDCFSEVVFETNGTRYVSHWSQHKARKKKDGKLASPKHEISIAESGKLLASRLSEASQLIVRLSGMDFSRFTQSMMLAQGGFAVFLQASANERAPILEQITGTEIYSGISKKVFEQQREELHILKELKAANEGIIILDADEEQQIKQETKDKKEKNQVLKTTKEKLVEAITWLKGIDVLNKDLVQINQNEIDLKQKLKEFEPQRQVHKEALQAAEFESVYATIQALQKQQKEEKITLNNLHSELPKLSIEVERTNGEAEKAKNHCDVLNKGEAALGNLLKAVRETDQILLSTTNDVKTQKSGVRTIENDLLREEKNKQKREATLKKMLADISSAKIYLEKNTIDSGLVAQLSGIASEIANLDEVRKKLNAIQTKLVAKLSEQKKTIWDGQLREKGAQEAKDKSQRKKAEISQNQTTIEKLLKGYSLSDYRNKKDKILLEIAGLKKVLNYEEERKLLRDNTACPVCGATDHPYAEGNIPEPSGKEKALDELHAFILTIEKLEAKKQVLLDEGNFLSKKIIEAENQLKMAEQKKLDINSSIIDLKEEEKIATINNNEKAAYLLQLLSPFGVMEVPHNVEELSKLKTLLTDRKIKWEKNHTLKINQETKIDSTRNEITVLAAILEEKQKSLTKTKGEVLIKEASLDKLVVQRKGLFGDKNCDREEELMKEKVGLATQAFQKTSRLNQEAKSKFGTAKNRLVELDDSTSIRQKDLSDKNANFTIALVQSGFANEELFLKARRSKNERDLLALKTKELDTNKIRLETLKKDNEDQLKLELSKNITDKTLDFLEKEQTELEKQIDSAGKEIGALEQKLKDNETAKVRGQKIKDRIDAQQKIFERWDKLNTLIGSADGKKYRNFAQGLTFELMVAYANKQLTKLSGRYLLIRETEKPLDLNVIDNYQAGEIRSTKNLSGGESFIVSLALALGLSQMSSKNVRVDSLFLDEGFGTLDADTLETALGTLASLRQEGKMIGLISHVGALKDRISTQINVQPIREGRSVLSGPGCSQN